MTATANGLLQDYAGELRIMLVGSMNDRDALDEFARGRRFGIYEALALLLNQIDAFGLDRAELGLLDFNADALL